MELEHDHPLDSICLPDFCPRGAVARVLDALAGEVRDIQRYSLTIEPDDSAYMELDPDGRYIIADEAESLIEAHRPKGGPDREPRAPV